MGTESQIKVFYWLKIYKNLLDSELFLIWLSYSKHWEIICNIKIIYKKQYISINYIKNIIFYN